MRRTNWDLGAAAILSIIVVVLVLSSVSDVFPLNVLSVLLVLVLPGYALIAALFPGRQLDVPEWVAMSLGASLALSALGGLVLHWAPVQLEATSWAVLLASATCLLTVIALIRRGRQVSVPPTESPRKVQISWQHAAFALAAVLITVIALAFAQNEARDQVSADFTQLWALPANEDGSIEVGVNNQHDVELQYQLVLFTDGSEFRTFTFSLEPDAEWTAEVSVPDESASIEARLYLQDEPQDVHRRVTLSL